MGDVLNNQGIFLADVFVVDYYETKLFFQVVKTRANSVFLIELQTEPYNYGVKISIPVRPAEYPCIIKRNNTERKTTYEVYPIKLEKDWWLPIEYDGFIHYATKIDNWQNKYWDLIWNEQDLDIN